MRYLPYPALLFPCCLALAVAGCAGTDHGLRNTVVLHYQHVANVERIDFSMPVVVPRRDEPVHFVQPLESEGFWAVFLLCALDATGANIPSFYFDVDRFRVQYGKQRFGPLRPYTLRLDDTVDLNTYRSTAPLAAAINAELRTGPPSQVFRHGYYPGLDMRFAIFIPRGLADYAGGSLKLRYEGAQVLALPNDYPPASLPSAGPGGDAVSAHCLP
jgi:hypothetical protein